MKILHTSDWHLGKRLEHISRMEEQEAVLQEIQDIAEQENVDAIIIAGDLFDTYNPPAEAVDLFYRFLKRMANDGKRAVIAIAGNHDAPERIEAPDPLARECGIIFSGFPGTEVKPFELSKGIKIVNSEPGFVELKLPECSDPLRVILTPYANELRLKTYTGQSDLELRLALQEKWTNVAEKHCDNNGVNVLLTHLFLIDKSGEIPEEPEDEKPILHVGGAQAIYTENIPGEVQYTALGHLHGRRVYNNNSVTAYSGSPLSYSFAEAGQQKSVFIVNVEAEKKPELKTVVLKQGKPLIRKRFESVSEAILWLQDNQHALVELTLVTDEFLKAEERKQVLEAHKGIVSIIPEIRNKELLTQSKGNAIDLSKDRESLFKDYFLLATGQEVNDELLSVYKEITASEE